MALFSLKKARILLYVIIIKQIIPITKPGIIRSFSFINLPPFESEESEIELKI